MRSNLLPKKIPKAPKNPQVPFTLNGTLEQYEVAELDPEVIALLLAEKRRPKSPRD